MMEGCRQPEGVHHFARSGGHIEEFACVAAPMTPLPGTGAADGSGVALAALATSMTLLAGGYVLRRRGHTA